MQVTETEYRVGSTDYLKLIAQNGCHLRWERSVPAGRLNKRDVISIMLDDGRALELSTPQGFRVSPIQVPSEILDQFLRASFVRQHGPAQADGSIIFRLTEDGRQRGLR
jgi:hypothetical protein